MKPRLLDLFCCQGGAGEGYRRAGFDVTGVDIELQPRNPHPFIQADALAYLAAHGHEYDAIHASPPCQAYSVAAKGWNGRDDHPDLVGPTRDALRAIGKPYVIENVIGAPMLDAITLCGSSFGLNVRRHRLFECSFPIMAPPCAHHLQTERKFPQGRAGRSNLSAVVSVFGSGGGAAKDKDLWAEAMGIDWMDKHGLSQAIPPTYTEFIGGYLLAAVTATRLDVAA